MYSLVRYKLRSITFRDTTTRLGRIMDSRPTRSQIIHGEITDGQITGSLITLSL